MTREELVELVKEKQKLQSLVSIYRKSNTSDKTLDELVEAEVNYLEAQRKLYTIEQKLRSYVYTTKEY